jgi:hypothetical protein
MLPSVVYRNGVEFQFPHEVMVRCRLRPYQNLNSKQFWRALCLHAELSLHKQG